MKRLEFLFVCSASLLLVHTAAAGTNILAIHLTADEDTKNFVLHATGRAVRLLGPALGAVRLSPEPVLADSDFVAYDVTNHIFALTPKAAIRLAERLRKEDVLRTLASGEVVYELSWPDTPFVLTVGGEPLYAGVFSDALSAFSHGLPVVESQDHFLRTNSQVNPTFVISEPRRDSIDDLQTDQLAGEPGRFGGKLAVLGRLGATADVRADTRVLAALKKLGLLRAESQRPP